MRKQAQVVRVGTGMHSADRKDTQPNVLNPALDLRGFVKRWLAHQLDAIETDRCNALDDLLKWGRPKDPVVD